MFNGEVDSKQFSSEGGVARFGWQKAFGKERERLSNAIYGLLQDCTDSGVGGVSGEGQRCLWIMMRQRSYLGDSFLQSFECGFGFVVEGEAFRFAAEQVGERCHQLNALRDEAAIIIDEAVETSKLGARGWLRVIDDGLDLVR